MDKEDMIEAGILTEEPMEETGAETAPQEETGEENPETEAAGEESGAPSAADSHTAEENSQTAENEPAPFALGVQYGGETRSLNEQEATDYAEKGMEYEAITPMLDKLRMLAAGCGKELGDMVDELLQSHDDARYRQLLEEASGNEQIARRLLEVEQAERQRTYETKKQETAAAAQSQREQLTQRLASEFVELKAEFPEVGEFKSIPESVVNTAIRQGIHLMDAYGRWERAERRRVQDAKDSASKAAASSTGSQRDLPPTGNPDPMLAALERGLGAGLN